MLKSLSMNTGGGETTGRPVRRDRTALRDLRYRRLLGEDAWKSLPFATQNRFSAYIGPRDTELYRGCVEETRFNLFGRILTFCLRPFSAPLPTTPCETPISASVSVTRGPGDDNQIWIRSYSRHDGFPQVIVSQKRFSGKTGLEEQVGGLFGMSLILKVEHRAMVFESADYFCSLFGIRIPIPQFLTPGRLRVEHRDAGDGTFDFLLFLTHPVFGELVYQRARFHDMAET